jgi:hypothetical protein
MTEPNERWVSIERRLVLLEAREAVAATIRRYATALDYGEDDAWVDCFLEDGVFEVRYHTIEAIKVCGHAALRPFVAAHSKAPGRWHKHITTQHEICIENDTATAQSYILRIDRDDRRNDVPTPWVFGRYIDKLTCCADGCWRFSYRIIELEGVIAEERAGLEQFDKSAKDRARN